MRDIMATRKVRASYQEIIDMHTEADHVTAVGIHTPTGDFPHKMFKGYFEQYKKYKYLGCSIKFIPLARLPVDPLQVGFESGEQMNPVDLANPILFHGCHGDDLGVILNTLYGNDDGISDSLVGLDGGQSYPMDVGGAILRGFMERLYYKALTDKSWKKAHIQRGFQKSGLRPLVYSLATNRQIMPSLALGEDVKTLDSDDFGDPIYAVRNIDGQYQMEVQNRMQLFTPRLTRLGWMDTRNVITTPSVIDSDSSDPDDLPGAILKAMNSEMNYAQLPKLFMGCILLPPSTSPNGFKQYFRVIINHAFAFAQFRGISFQPDALEVPTYWNKNDAEDLFDMEDGHFNPVEMPGDDSGGGGDEPTITVTPLSIQVVNNSSSSVQNVIYIKYPGTANFVPFHSMTSTTSGSTNIWQTVNVPVGAVIGRLYPDGEIRNLATVVARTQNSNVYRLTFGSDGVLIVEYPVSLTSESTSDVNELQRSVVDLNEL